MYQSRRIAPLILVVIITILVIAILVAVGRALLHKPSATEEAEVDVVKEHMLSTDSSHKVQMTVRGPIVGDEDFRSYQITVTPEQRTFVSYKGYLDEVIKRKTFKNNVPAYEEFAYALYRVQMMDGEELEGEDNDLRGICSGGQLYEFALLEGGNIVKQLWTSNCKKSKGSLRASANQVGEMFVKQIPDGKKLIRESRATPDGIFSL